MGTVLWVYRSVRDFLLRDSQNAVSAYSAQAALFLVISFFPFAIFAIALLPYMPVTETQITGVFLEIVPEAIAEYGQSIVQELYTSASISLLSVAAVVALWSSSKGSLALMHGLNRIYGVHRNRGYFFARLIGSLYVLVFFVLLIVILAFLGFGRVALGWLSRWIPVLETSVFLKGSLQYIVSLAVLSLLFLLMYIAVPQRRTTLLRELPGAVIAAFGWCGFSSLYSLYLDNIGGISIYYGSLSLIVLSLLWLYFCMYILFVGAEINVWLYENHVFRKGKSADKQVAAEGQRKGL